MKPGMIVAGKRVPGARLVLAEGPWVASSLRMGQEGISVYRAQGPTGSLAR